MNARTTSYTHRKGLIKQEGGVILILGKSESPKEFFLATSYSVFRRRDNTLWKCMNMVAVLYSVR
jgi:hypothetical protein